MRLRIFVQHFGLVLITANVGHRQRHGLTVADDVCGAVPVAGRRTILRVHLAELPLHRLHGSVVGVIDEVDGDDPRAKSFL